MTDGKILDPWPGYSDQSESDRLTTLEHKVGEARRRGDLLYARAVSVAVAAVEALKRGDGQKNQLEEEAASLARKIDQYGESQLKEAGGWTPK
jgi:hypothetical protein